MPDRFGPLGSSATGATSPAYAATVTPAPSPNSKTIVNVGTLTGNITLANPTGTPVDGQILVFRLVQDGTGTRTVAFGNAYVFGTDVTLAMIPTTASAKCEVLFEWNALDSKWRAVAITRGF